MGRQKTLKWMLPSITRIQSALNFCVNAISIDNVILKYLNFVPFSRGLLAVGEFWFCPAFWWEFCSRLLLLLLLLLLSHNRLKTVSNKIFVSNIIRPIGMEEAGPNGRAVWVTYCLRPLEHWDRGFESHSRHGCVSAFLCVVLSCV
jgi:hypothetical protein